MALTIATALLPVFFVMALGFFAGKRRIVDNTQIGSLNHLVMLIALPIALFTSIASTDRSVIVHNWWLAVVLLLVMVVVYAVLYALQKRVFGLGTGDAAVYTLTAAFPNYASIGLPLTAAVFGPSAALAVAVAIAVGSVTISPLTIALLEIDKAREAGASGSPARLFLRALGTSVRKPIFVGPMIGVVWSLVGLPMPDLAVTTLKMIGGVAAGVALFVTGLILSAQKIRINGNVVLGALAKTVVQPALAALLIWALHVPEPYASQALLLVAIPGGFFGILFGANYGKRPQDAGSTLVLSSLLSIVTLSAVIAMVSSAA